MQHPLKQYTFKLAERIGMRQRVLADTMDMEEILEWLAYDLSCNDDFKAKAAREIDIANQLKYTAEQEAARFRQFFGV